MRNNYNRPQMRGYWDAPKSKDDSRLDSRSVFRSFLCLVSLCVGPFVDLLVYLSVSGVSVGLLV